MTRSALANSIAGCLAAAGLTAIIGVAGAGAAAAATPRPTPPNTTGPSGAASTLRPTPAITTGPSGAPSDGTVATPPLAPGIEVPAGNAGQLRSGGGTSDAEIVLIGLGVVLVGGASVVGVRRR